MLAQRGCTEHHAEALRRYIKDEEIINLLMSADGLETLAPRLSNRAAVAFLWAYPWLTVFAIVVTANHYWIDGVGGLIVLGAGMWGAQQVMKFLDRQHQSPSREENASPSF